MAITYDTKTTKQASATNSMSWSHTCASDANLLVMSSAIHTGGSGRAITSITYGGVAMTAAKVVDTCEIWYLVNPSSGANTLAITWSGSPTYLSASAVSFKGADTANPLIDTDSAGPVVGTPSLTLTTNRGGVVVDSYYEDDNDGSAPGAGQTAIMGFQFPSNTDWSRGSYEIATGSSVTMSWSYNSNYIHAAASFRAKINGGGFILTQL